MHCKCLLKLKKLKSCTELLLHCCPACQLRPAQLDKTNPQAQKCCWLHHPSYLADWSSPSLVHSALLARCKAKTNTASKPALSLLQPGFVKDLSWMLLQLHNRAGTLLSLASQRPGSFMAPLSVLSHPAAFLLLRRQPPTDPGTRHLQLPGNSLIPLIGAAMLSPREAEWQGLSSSAATWLAQPAQPPGPRHPTAASARGSRPLYCRLWGWDLLPHTLHSHLNL